MQVTERRLSGRPAAPGIAFGRTRVIEPAELLAGLNATETLAPGPSSSLIEAIKSAAAQLRSLQAGQAQVVIDILQFQIELLEDPELTAGVYASIEQGADSRAAFVAAIDTHLSIYTDSGSDYVRARAADVIDMRDRVLAALAPQPCRLGGLPADVADRVLILRDISPTTFLAVARYVRGIATLEGSPFSHVAMLARSAGVPMLVDLQADALPGSDQNCILDCDGGALILEPAMSTRDALHFKEQAAVQSEAESAAALEDAVTASGVRIRVYANVDSPEILGGANCKQVDGIGLTRSELFLPCVAGVPAIPTQIDAYRQLFDWCAGRITTIRLLDAGADKPIPGFTSSGEINPSLGMRGVRLLLRHPEILRGQLTAIVTAASGRPVRILVPMVAIPWELAACRTLLEEVIGELAADRRSIQLGMMVETPAAALTVENFAADFFSVGTNDLAQYVMAASRDAPQLEYLHQASGPGVLELLRRVARFGSAAGREVSVCGEAACVPEVLEAMLGAGICAVSVPPRYVAGVKSLIRNSSMGAHEQGGSTTVA